MKKVSLCVLLTAPVVLAGCQPQEGALGAAEGGVVMELPVTTSSDAARSHFDAGLEAADMGRANDANAHFELAIEADPGFAQGYLRVAFTSASTEEFTTNLATAVELSQSASQAEQLMIMITQRGFERDVEGQLALAEELVELEPESPRAWLTLAGIQAGMNDIADSRNSIANALDLAPSMAAAHMQLGNNYLFLEPKDFASAERHFQAAIDAAPDEPNPYDLMGDVHRAQGNLEAAYQDYTMAADRAPTMGSPLQQRGHVNSFLGNYDEARADYTTAMDLEDARGTNNAPFFAPFRAYVNIHAGDPEAAVAELTELVATADAMNIEGAIDVKINALNNIVQIATHYGDWSTATTALEDLAILLRQQAEDVGTEQFSRGQEGAIVYWEGMIAARQGDTRTAEAKAAEFATLVEPDANPRKMEPVHQILGITEFYQENYVAAVEHLDAGNPNNIYMQYYRAVALDEIGRSDEADAVFEKLAVYNFNGLGYAMTRADIIERAGE